VGGHQSGEEGCVTRMLQPECATKHVARVRPATHSDQACIRLRDGLRGGPALQLLRVRRRPDDGCHAVRGAHAGGGRVGDRAWRGGPLLLLALRRGLQFIIGDNDGFRASIVSSVDKPLGPEASASH
jgi:hypothetical protein